MAANPDFASTPLVGSATLSATADSSYTAPTHAVSVVSAGASGSKIEEVRFVGTGTTVAGVVVLYLYDGTNYHVYDSVVVTVVTPSTTQGPFEQVNAYPNLELPNGWSLYATSFVASQLINVVATGGSY